MAMMAAEVLGLADRTSAPIVADTDSIGYTDVTGGSRITFATGMARAGRREGHRPAERRAAKIWEMSPDEVDWRDG